jgi:hypothetical protein
MALHRGCSLNALLLLLCLLFLIVLWWAIVSAYARYVVALIAMDF